MKCEHDKYGGYKLKCKYCNDSGCDDCNYHEREVYKKAIADVLKLIDKKIKELREADLNISADQFEWFGKELKEMI